jgi:hypothetical protein
MATKISTSRYRSIEEAATLETEILFGYWARGAKMTLCGRWGCRDRTECGVRKRISARRQTNTVALSLTFKVSLRSLTVSKHYHS